MMRGRKLAKLEPKLLNKKVASIAYNLVPEVKASFHGEPITSAVILGMLFRSACLVLIYLSHLGLDWWPFTQKATFDTLEGILDWRSKLRSMSWLLIRCIDLCSGKVRDNITASDARCLFYAPHFFSTFRKYVLVSDNNGRWDHI